ncbi:aspartic peptidase domain-containing protein [Mycena rosella]|uniref:Aspartic peptidase domain-containing protein n=1 Tax=Mycena rosella TaxID=1033263 RepID=A0AAD7DE69_MYCRO|nr:aspartic peptidase domain-containing protein [Mycena rosella]
MIPAVISSVLGLAAATAALATAPHSDFKLGLSSARSNPSARRARHAAATLPQSKRALDPPTGTNDPAVFDTRSVALEIPGTSCAAACAKQRQFNSSASNTFQNQAEEDNTITFGTGVGVDPVNGSDWSLTVNLVVDTVSVVAALSVPLRGFYLITDQTPTFSDPFDVIMGISPGTFLFSDAGFPGGGGGGPGIFGMCFKPGSEAELTFGGVETTKFTAPLVYSPLLTTNFDERPPTDLARTLLLFVEAIALAIYRMISPDIVANPDESGTYGIARDIAGQSPFNLTIPSSELTSAPFASNTALCQTLINVSEAFTVNLVGLSLLKHFYSAWDVDGQRMGFTPNGFYLGPYQTVSN